MVEAEEPGQGWFKSSYSTSGACVEVWRRGADVLVRDSEHPGGPVLSFDAETFDDFLRAVKRGEFDRPSPPK